MALVCCLAINYVVISCAASKIDMTTYYYTDQNNNSYSITASEVIYNPVKASESSSGYYDGGEPARAGITTETFQKISKMTETLLLNTEAFAKQREMRTAILSVSKNKQTIRAILKPSKERSAFEDLLQNALK
jgi:hypothetical protein